MTEKNKEKITLYIDKELARKFRIIATFMGKRYSELAEEIFTEALKDYMSRIDLKGLEEGRQG